MGQTKPAGRVQREPEAGCGLFQRCEMGGVISGAEFERTFARAHGRRDGGLGREVRAEAEHEEIVRWHGRSFAALGRERKGEEGLTRGGRGPVDVGGVHGRICFGF